jgi:hypothetical protein
MVMLHVCAMMTGVVALLIFALVCQTPGIAGLIHTHVSPSHLRWGSVPHDT